jgi:MFS transporter, ACS family, glucarate transporter
MGQEDVTREPLASNVILPEPSAPVSRPSILRPTRVRYQVLAAACAVAVIIYIHRVGFASALPAVAADLDLGSHHSGWLMAAFLLAYGGLEVPWGRAGDRAGVRNLLPILVLGWSLMTACVGLAFALRSQAALAFAVLLALRFLFGAFQAGAFPLLSRMMTDWMPTTERGSAQGAIWMSTRLGAVLVPPLVMGLTGILGSWPAALGLLAGLGVVWSVLFWPWFRNRPEQMSSVNDAERAVILAGRAARPARHGAPWGRMLRSRSVWALCFMYGFGAFSANFYVTLLPIYLIKERHVVDTQAAWLTSAPFAFGAISCILGGRISDTIIRRTGNRKWGRRLNGTIGMSLGALAWPLLNVAPAPWGLAAVLCFIFFCNDLAMGPAWASCADIGERHAGTLGGAMNMFGNLLSIGGTLLTGYLFKEGHADWVFVIFGCSFALAAFCWLNVDATKTVVEKA